MGRRTLVPNGVGAEGSTLQKDAIIQTVALQMAEGAWHPYRSVRELAARTGVSLGNAQKYAAEASRVLRLSWGAEEAKVAVLERIASIGQKAEARTEEALDAAGNVHLLSKPDHRTALQAAKHLADMLGLSGSNSEVVIRLQTLSDSDLLREVQSLAAEIGRNRNGIETSGQEVTDEHDDEAALGRIVAHHRGT